MFQFGTNMKSSLIGGGTLQSEKSYKKEVTYD